MGAGYPPYPAPTAHFMRMVTRRALVALVPAGVLLGGCGSAVNAPAPKPEPVSLTYWKSLSGVRHEAQVRLVEAFHAQQDGVRVSLEHAGEYGPAAEKLRLALAAGAPPDVAMIGTNAELPSFARAGALQPLEPLARGDVGLLERYYAGFLRDSSVNGKLFQLPFARSVPLLYVNRDAFARHGLPESAPETWEGLLDAAGRLTRAAGDPSAALGLGTSWWDYQSLLWSHGGAYSDERRAPRVDAPGSLQAFQFLTEPVHRQGVAVATKRAQVEFFEGGRALYLGSSATLTEALHTRLFRAEVAALPLGPSRRRELPGGGAGLSIPINLPRRQVEAAWRFVRFMTDAPQTAFFARQTGYQPVQPGAALLTELADLYAQYPGARLAADQVRHVRPNDPIVGVPTVTSTIERSLTRLLFEGAEVRQTCEALAHDLRLAASRSGA